MVSIFNFDTKSLELGNYYYKSFQTYILFNSILLSQHDLNSTIFNNFDAPGCSPLYSQITTEYDFLNPWCVKADPKCPRKLLDSSPLISTFGSQKNVCQLKGQFKNASIIIEHGASHQSFIYIFIQGCCNFKSEYIWSITNNTYLKYSFADMKNATISKNLSVKLIDGLKMGCNCQCFCTVLYCRVPAEKDNGNITKKNFRESLFIFGILVAIVTSIGCLWYVIYKYYNLV